MTYMIIIIPLIPEYADRITRLLVEHCKEVKSGWTSGRVSSICPWGRNCMLGYRVEPKVEQSIDDFRNGLLKALNEEGIYHHGVVIVEGWRHYAASLGNLPTIKDTAVRKPEPPPKPPDTDSLESDWKDVRGKAPSV